MEAWTDTLLDAIDGFLGRHGLAASRLGKRVLNDANLVFQVRAGRGLTLPKADRLRAYMAGFDDGVAHGSPSAPADPFAAAAAPDPAPQVARDADRADAPRELQAGGAAPREAAQPAGEGAGQNQQGVGR